MALLSFKCFYFPSNNFAFLQRFLLSCNFFFAFLQIIFIVFLQIYIFLLYFKYFFVAFLQIFFLLLSFKYFCVPSNIFLLSCVFFYFPSNIFAFLQFSFKYLLLSFKYFLLFSFKYFFLLSFKYFCFPSNIFLLSFKCLIAIFIYFTLQQSFKFSS